MGYSVFIGSWLARKGSGVVRYWDVLLQELLADARLRVVDRGLYLAIFEHEPGSLRELERLSGLSRRAVRPACERLVKARWLRMERADGRGGMWRPVPMVPAECQALQFRCLQDEADMAAFRGEFLMRRLLDLLVRDRAFVDNARSAQLEQPGGRRLECDRLYLRGVGV